MTYTCENSILKRQFEVVDGKLRTICFSSVLHGRRLISGENSKEFVICFTDKSRVFSDELTVREVSGSNRDLTVDFEEYDGLKVSVRFFTGENDLVIKKQISFTDSESRAVDRIVMEYIDLSNASQTACSPTDISGTELSGYHSSLGQPFFADSFFFGSEFPATENRIKDGVGKIVYYSGKRICGEFRSPIAVVGGGKSNIEYRAKRAFFDYIESIALPCKYRLQYNSWYDGMMDINEEQIKKTFSSVAEDFRKYGVPTPDAYTVDDGWNDYGSSFWSFNSKFPDGLESVLAITKANGSSLGLWLGPRGGYNSHTASFAKRMQRRKTGAYNPYSRDICVADKTYQKNVRDFLSETVSRLDLSYLKLDGFCLKPCDKKRHNHTVGGENDMYFITEMWENWIDIFKSLRALRQEQGKDLWINMTCYVNPSPWFLQYVNSLWLQNSNDIGFSKAYKNQSQADSEMTYRDARYFEYLEKRRFNMPLCRIYNHEPIYGISANVDYTDADFEKYIMFCACRGQSLNELHLSCSMMNSEKWKMLGSALNWQKDNYGVLKNAVFVGGDPEKDNAYAYCSFTRDGRGIVAVRNPSDLTAEFGLKLDEIAGCPEGEYKVGFVFGRKQNLCEKYSYGETVNFRLNPFEILILSFEAVNSHGKTDEQRA